MLRALFLTTCAVAVLARTSPHAGSINELYRSQDGSQLSDDILEDASLDVPGLIAKYKYPVEVHTVVTSDGYILEMHRIPHGRDSNNDPNVKRPVAFVMHGLLSSSADFITIGPGSALGYHLAEAGYDVWLGNARGNYYSRKHITLDPNNSNDFWRFSWDDIGNNDLPACIDYILDVTGQPKVHYIGHSQGGTTFLVLNSLRPEYNAKFHSFQGLAPASYFTYNENKIFNTLAPFEAIIEAAAWALGIGEFFGDSDFAAWFQDNFCNGDSSSLESLCSVSLSSIADRDYYNSTMVPVILAHTPAGSSGRQVAHFGQVIRFDAFRRYNYALPLSNFAAYGSFSPPTYDLSLVTAPTYLHYGMADEEVDYRDVLKLADVLPNVVKVNKASRDSFNHFDFLWAIDATVHVYNSVVEYMHEAQNA